jgi:hypothetical protein
MNGGQQGPPQYRGPAGLSKIASCAACASMAS